MLYIVGLIVLLFAIIIIYVVRIFASFVTAIKAHRAAKRDPESADDGPVKRPSLRAVAREVTHTMFPPRQQSPHVPAHRRSSVELARRGWVSTEMAVTRVETRDGELPTYQESHTMPKPPAAIYSASAVHPTAARTEAEQASAPVPDYTVGQVPHLHLPPQYQEQPVIRT